MTDQTETELTLLVGAALEKHGSWPEGAHRAIANTILEAGWRAPSTQDETEYGVRLTNGTVLGPWGHTEANGFMSGCHPYGTLMQRRPAGPWVSVSSVEGDKP